MTIKESITQPEAFAWLINPFQLRVENQVLIDACKPLCDWIDPVSSRDARTQLERYGSFKEVFFPVDMAGVLRRNNFRFVPLMELKWIDESVYLYGRGGWCSIVTFNGKVTVLQYQKEP